MLLGWQVPLPEPLAARAAEHVSHAAEHVVSQQYPSRQSELTQEAFVVQEVPFDKHVMVTVSVSDELPSPEVVAFWFTDAPRPVRTTVEPHAAVVDAVKRKPNWA
ncbi:MAG: hypothetical protein M5U28_34365 [Sandaracinaceae bacterium]|nr:hypothetical protein [Sandaracinaceae bacterium]